MESCRIYIANGLDDIHKCGLIHHDFHGGNILCDKRFSYITDLGLCKPANEKNFSRWQ